MRIRNPNGSGTLEVTKGAYREIYAHLGWVPDVEPEKASTPHSHEEEENPHESHEEQPEDELELQNEGQEDHEEDMEDELEEKPISLMSFEELKEYATRLDIDTTGLRSKKELRLRIKQHM